MARKKKQEQGAEQSAPSFLVRMERDGKTADVHPDEVENRKRADWREVAPARED